MKHAKLTAEPRTVLGKKVKTLRRAGQLPANIYGHNVESTAITLDAHAFGLLYRNLLPTTVIDLSVANQTRPVLLSKAVASPRNGQLIHVEFKQVNLREKVTAVVTILGTGESELMRAGDAILLQSLDSLQVSALPDDLPADIEVDLSALVDFDTAIHVADLKLDRSRVEVLTLGDELVFKLTQPQLADEESEAEIMAEEAAGQSEPVSGAAAGEGE